MLNAKNHWARYTLKNAGLIMESLDLKRPLPLSVDEMATTLEVTFFPPHERTARLDAFSQRLKNVLEKIGVNVIPFEQALVSKNEQRVKPGIAIFEQGEGESGKLAVQYVSNLYENPVIGIYDHPSPVGEHLNLQDTLDAIVGVMAWNMTQIPIFVEEDRWTICTMNGSAIRCRGYEQMEDDVRKSLLPKLAGQVVPPKSSDIIYHEGAFDIHKEGYIHLVDDYIAGARIWRENGLMLAHTSLESVQCRNRFYKRIVRAYLDHRTGMSYGFMVRQLPTPITPAVKREDASPPLRDHDWSSKSGLLLDGKLYGKIDLSTTEWIAEIPDVWLLSTRSGCDKTNLDPERDIIKMGFSKGDLIVHTPVGMSAGECRPSYDTLVMIAHAVGNAIAASVLATEKPNSAFPRILSTKGLSISHWHGYPVDGIVPEGYALYGRTNPPVSCSTPQSAVYAFVGKMEALKKTIEAGREYLGDVHVEPHHGTNMTGHMSLADTAAWVGTHYGNAQHIGAVMNEAVG